MSETVFPPEFPNIGDRLSIQNPRTGKTVIEQVSDRKPFMEGFPDSFVINLSGVRLLDYDAKEKTWIYDDEGPNRIEVNVTILDK